MVNAFWLDRDLNQAARWLVDTHVTSSVFECSMTLTTAAQLHGYPEHDDLYFGYPTHPLTKWAAHSYANWQRLYEYTDAAHTEWQYRWNHTPDDRHKSWTVVGSLDLDRVEELDWPTATYTDPPQITGDWTAPNYVDAYRFYYANEKHHLFQWKNRDRPSWIDAYTIESTHE